MRLFISIIFGSILLSGCDGNPFEKMKKERESKKLVIESLKDGESAKFRNVNGECGEVNAKNGFGAYTGFKRYMTPLGLGPFLEENKPSMEFETLWYEYCTDASSKVDLKECKIYAGNASILFQDYLLSMHSNYYANAYIETVNRAYKQLKDKKPKHYESIELLNDKIMTAAKSASSDLDDREKEGEEFAIEMFKECASGQVPMFKLNN